VPAFSVEDAVAVLLSARFVVPHDPAADACGVTAGSSRVSAAIRALTTASASARRLVAGGRTVMGMALLE
jgi:hypothetical protein